MVREQVTNTLELMCQELESLKEAQSGSNPMDVSLIDNADLSHECNKAEQEKHKLAEELERIKTEYEQALASKSHEVSLEIERIKKHMEEQMRKERAEATKTSEHQLQSIMSELRALKEKHEKDTKARKVDEKKLLENIKASIDPILKSDYKSDHIGVGARLKHFQEEVTNYLPPTVNKKCGAAVTTDDTFGDLTLGGYRDAKHVHFASTPIRPEVSNINLTPPHIHKEETIAESVLHNTMQTLASEFKQTREPKIQKFRGGTSSGTLLVFKSWMQDIECAIKDRNLNNDEALQLVKEFSEGCACDNINFYLEVTDKPSVDGLFENLRQVFSSGEEGQQMLAEFYSCVQNPKETVKEFGESLLQIARKIMTTKPEFKVDIENTLKARFADGLRDHYHQAMAREMIRSCPTISYVAYKSEVLKTLGPNVKPRSITTSKLETSDTESPPKKHKRESELDQKINAAIEENRKLSECLSAFNPKTITNTVINAVQGNYASSKPAGFTPKQFKPSQFYGKPCEPQLVPGTDGSLKPETDCNYCKDLGHLKYNCPKLKEKEARMAGHQNYNKSKKEN